MSRGPHWNDREQRQPLKAPPPANGIGVTSQLESLKQYSQVCHGSVQELRDKNVLVTTIYPGYMATEMTKCAHPSCYI